MFVLVCQIGLLPFILLIYFYLFIYLLFIYLLVYFFVRLLCSLARSFVRSFVRSFFFLSHSVPTCMHVFASCVQLTRITTSLVQPFRTFRLSFSKLAIGVIK